MCGLAFAERAAQLDIGTSMYLTYGDETLELSAPGEARLLLPEATPPAEPEALQVRRALEHPVGTPPLEAMALGRHSAIILIACRTRRTGSAVFLPEIIRALNAGGISDDRILVYAATGTHDNWRAEDAALLAGADCARRLRFLGHDCRSALVSVGTTSRGNHVMLSRKYLEADLKIATGRVTYHYFAGFTGGRKAILPGVAGFETIVFNHRMATRIETTVDLDPDTRNGNLENNPIHQDMLEAARLAPPDFTLSTVLNTRNEIVHAFGGDMVRSHALAVEKVRASDAPTVERPVDWLFLSCGGAHCDVNTVQAMKALINNYEAVRPGGAIIFAAECAEGTAPWLREICSIRDRRELESRIVRGELRHPHNALFLRRVNARAHVLMISALAAEDVRVLGFRKAESLAEATALARDLAGRPETTGIVPFGNTTVARAPAATALQAAA
jgi:nickel-dependent lactate racemase